MFRYLVMTFGDLQGPTPDFWFVLQPESIVDMSSITELQISLPSKIQSFQGRRWSDSQKFCVFIAFISFNNPRSLTVVLKNFPLREKSLDYRIVSCRPQILYPIPTSKANTGNLGVWRATKIPPSSTRCELCKETYAFARTKERSASKGAVACIAKSVVYAVSENEQKVDCIGIERSRVPRWTPWSSGMVKR